MVLSYSKNALALLIGKRAILDDDSASAENTDHTRAISSLLIRFVMLTDDFLSFVTKKLQINPVSLDADARQFRWIAWSLLIMSSPPQYLL